MEKRAVGRLSARPSAQRSDIGARPSAQRSDIGVRPSAQRSDIGVSGGGKQVGPSGAQPEYLNWGGAGRGVYTKKLYFILKIML